jgi:hypothetical protein
MMPPTHWGSTEARLRRLVACNGYAAYQLTLVGNPAPFVQEVGDRIRHPQPGDVVLETSTFYHWARKPDGEPGPALGVLLRKVQEPIMSREQFDKLHADGDYYNEPDETYESLPTELIWYIEPLDGAVPEYRWHNADFIGLHSGAPR